MHFRGGREWCDNLTRVAKETGGIVRAVGIPLYVLLALASPPTWVHICFGRKDPWITDAYVFGVLVFCGFRRLRTPVPIESGKETEAHEPIKDSQKLPP